MGTALSMIGRRDEAVAQFEYSLRFQPQRPLTFYNLGLSYGELGRAEEAEAWYLGALRHGRTEKRDQERQGLYNPQHAKFMAGVYNNLGNLVHPQGRVGEAQAFYRSAVSVDPQHAMGYNNLGNTFKEPAKGVVLSDHAAEAGHAYATALALWPTYPECYKNLGNLLKERKEWWSASIAAYRSAVKLLPRERSAFLNLGELLGWLGRAHAANVTYALAVQRGVWAHPQQRPSHFVAGLRGRPWWEPSSLAQITRKLRAGYAALRDVLLALLAEGEEQFLNYHSPALVSGRWSDVTLAMSGLAAAGALRAPRSAKLLASLGPDVNTMVMGSAYFAVQSAARARAAARGADEHAAADPRRPLGARRRRDARRQRDARVGGGRRVFDLRRLVRARGVEPERAAAPRLHRRRVAPRPRHGRAAVRGLGEQRAEAPVPERAGAARGGAAAGDGRGHGRRPAAEDDILRCTCFGNR